jgi:hypothetical protein
VTHEDLVAAGYRKCAGPGPWTNADCFYQKCIRDGRAKLYFVNIGMWDHRKYDPAARVGWEAKAYLYRGEDRSYRLHVPIEDHDTIGDIEFEFRDFYYRARCVPDIHNQSE